MSIKTSLIFAMARNRAIGFKNDIPWYIPDDLKRFKALTLGHPCIMGRKTFDSIVARLGKPLPGRTTIVVSRSGFFYSGIDVYADINAAIAAAKKIAVDTGKPEIFICGGAEIYALTLPIADKLYVTEVDIEPTADAFMPMWDMSAYHETARTDITGDPSFSFVDLERS